MDCRLNDLKWFVSVLHSLLICSRKEFSVHVRIEPPGVLLSGISQASEVQVECFIPSEAFSYYTVHPQCSVFRDESHDLQDFFEKNNGVHSKEKSFDSSSSLSLHASRLRNIQDSLTFNLCLPSFLRYIQAFGLEASMQLTYRPEEYRIHLVLHEKNGRSECHIQVLTPEPLPPFPDAITQSENHLEIQPKRLREALIDLQDNADVESKVVIEAMAYDDSRCQETTERQGPLNSLQYVFSLEVTAPTARYLIEFPYNPAIFPCYCVREKQRYTYCLKPLLSLQKSLAIASTCHLYFLAHGVLHVTLGVRCAVFILLDDNFVVMKDVMTNRLNTVASTQYFDTPFRPTSTQQFRAINPPTFVQRDGLRFLILDAPHDSNLEAYIEELKKYNVTDFVRTCALTYNEAILAERGFRLYELTFDDGEPPSEDILEKWLTIVNDCHRRETTVAVHCLAGLGRAPVLVVVALIEYGVKNFEAVEFVRSRRRGAINKKQLEYLMSYRRRRKRFHCCSIM